MGLRVFLDDERKTPEGWTRTFNVLQTIEMLKTRNVSELSLDNDLGSDDEEGYDVLTWLEEQIAEDVSFPLPLIHLHTANASRRQDMQRAIESIHRIRQKQLEEQDETV